jgi:hypothetical protein
VIHVDIVDGRCIFGVLFLEFVGFGFFTHASAAFRWPWGPATRGL